MLDDVNDFARESGWLHAPALDYASYGVVAAELQRQGYALHNLASLPHISVAGAVATATHGSGDRNGNLATAVACLELVTADGGILTARREEPDYDGMVVFERDGERLCLINSKVMMMRQGKVIFSGTDEKLRRAEDPYIMRFLRGH